jgi:hypothetical protein
VLRRECRPWRWKQYVFRVHTTLQPRSRKSAGRSRSKHGVRFALRLLPASAAVVSFMLSVRRRQGVSEWRAHPTGSRTLVLCLNCFSPRSQNHDLCSCDLLCSCSQVFMVDSVVFVLSSARLLRPSVSSLCVCVWNCCSAESVGCGLKHSDWLFSTWRCRISSYKILLRNKAVPATVLERSCRLTTFFIVQHHTPVAVRHVRLSVSVK